MRVLGLLLAVAVCLASSAVADDPAYAAAVSNAQAALTAAQAKVTQLEGQVAAAAALVTAKQRAHEEAQQVVVSKRVVAAQAASHVTTATLRRNNAQSALTSFTQGPFTTAQTNYNQLAAQKPKWESINNQVIKSMAEVQSDFPADARTNAMNDLKTKQAQVAAFFNSYNNAQIAFNAAQQTRNSLANTHKAHQQDLDAKISQHTAANAAVQAAIVAREAAHNELRSARANLSALKGQLAQARQVVVVAVTNARNALERQYSYVASQLLAANQQKDAAASDVVAKSGTKAKFQQTVRDLETQIAELTRKHADFSQKLAEAISKYTIAQGNLEQARQRTANARNKVTQAQADIKKFNARNPPVTAPAPAAPTAPKKL